MKPTSTEVSKGSKSNLKLKKNSETRSSSLKRLGENKKQNQAS